MVIKSRLACEGDLTIEFRSFCSKARRWVTEVHPFLPYPEFTAGDSIGTLLFVSAHQVLYKNRRSDPIFPAPHPTNIEQFPEPSSTMNPSKEDPSRHNQRRPTRVYRATDARDTVLGCVDRAEVCSTDQGQCWDTTVLGLQSGTKIPFFNETAPVSERSLVLGLLAIALAGPSVCHAILAPTELDAQSKIRGFMADGLADEQWKVEVRRLFQASLAQMQLATFRVARGGWYYNDGYGRLWIPKAYEAMAGMVKFNAVGWLNVSVSGFLGLLFLAAAITLASIKTKDELWLIVWVRWGITLTMWGARGLLWTIKRIPYRRVRRYLLDTWRGH